MTDQTAGGTWMGGDCFNTAIELQHVLRAQGARVVHGLPTMAREGDDFGKRFWHAWVEATVDATTLVLLGCGADDAREHAGKLLIFDFSNGEHKISERDRFYELGNIETTFSYTHAQVTQLTRMWRHAGPWVRDWETYEHPDFNGVGVDTPT